MEPRSQCEHGQYQHHFRRHAGDPAESSLETIYVSHRTVGSTGQYANPAAFAEPAPGFLGNVSRNMLYGPGVENFDVSLDKNFAMPYNERHHLQIRLDAFNALNHTNFANPGVTNISIKLDLAKSPVRTRRYLRANCSWPPGTPSKVASR